jgi:hypothetical protein
MLWITNLSILMKSFSENFLVGISVLFLSIPKTYFHLCWPFFFMKHGWTNSFNLSFSFELGIVVYI